MTKAQKALFEKAQQNGGSVEVSGSQRMTARSLEDKGIFKLTGFSIYSIA